MFVVGGVKLILNNDGLKPIYQQIAEWLETEILNGHLTENQKVFSQYQLAELFTINPATAAKGLTLLAEEGIIYKKRGLGMFVSAEAKEHIMDKRKNQVLKQMIDDLVRESGNLEISEDELINMVRHVIAKRKGEIG